MNKPKDIRRVVIVGGGAAGLALASKLVRRYRKQDQVSITLIDQQLTHIWKPLVHEVAAGTFDSKVNEISFLAQSKRCGFHFRIIEGADRILPALPEHLSTATAAQLQQLRINIMSGEVVSAVTEEAIQTRSGKNIPCHIKVWAAGIKGPQAITQTDGLEINKINQLVVKKTLQSSRDKNIFATGDCAACEWTDGKVDCSNGLSVTL